MVTRKKRVKDKPGLPGDPAGTSAQSGEGPAAAEDASAQRGNASTSEAKQATGDESRRERIAAAAYLRAERRNFHGNGHLDDWLEAEREIDSLAAAGGIQGEASKRSEGPSDTSASAIRQDTRGEDEEERIEPDDVKRWAAELAVPAGSLRVAIERVGSRVADVKRFLEHHERK